VRGWPRTPPAWLTRRTAGQQPASISGPNEASGPVNGLNAPTTSVPDLELPPPDEEHPTIAATRNAATTFARTTRDLMPPPPCSATARVCLDAPHYRSSMIALSRRVEDRP